ncbi:MAG: preprotein translocase subunit YajC [Bacteroidaceae bacterium]|nr:preprotein translocase subunit YajC [Bacteroidaceae bacterium]
MTTALILMQAQQGGGMSMIIMLVLMIAIFYFFMIRPQRKRQKEIEAFRNSLTIGSEVITASGVYGKVKNLNEGEPYISIEIAKDVVIKVDRNYVYAKDNQPLQQQ